VRVVDPAGSEGLAVQDVAVRAGVSDIPRCERACDCVLGDECDGGLCYSTGGAID